MVQKTLRSIDTRSVQIFANEVRKFPRIDDERARLLATLAHKGSDTARNELCNSTLWYVLHLALKMNNQLYDSELEELIQQGSEGLLCAIAAFNPKQPGKFLNFAKLYIENRMKREFSNDHRVVHQPIYTLDLLRKLDKAANGFYLENGYEATPDDLSEITGIDYDTVVNLLKNRITDCSDSDSDPMYHEFDDSFADYAEADDKTYRIQRMMQGLTTREQYILVKRYGIDCEEMSVGQIAVTLGLTRERVRQILAKIETTMRGNAAA